MRFVVGIWSFHDSDHLIEKNGVIFLYLGFLLFFYHKAFLVWKGLVVMDCRSVSHSTLHILELILWYFRVFFGEVIGFFVGFCSWQGGWIFWCLYPSICSMIVMLSIIIIDFYINVNLNSIRINYTHEHRGSSVQSYHPHDRSLVHLNRSKSPPSNSWKTITFFTSPYAKNPHQ